MKRLQVGTLFGQVGMYISRPGDDLDNPTQSLLLDSRYDSLQLHEFGRAQMNKDVLPDQNITRYFSLGEVTFTSLGYRPTLFVAPVRRQNSIVTYYTTLRTSDGIINTFRARVGGNNNQVHVEFEIANDSGIDYDFLWVVYRNPA